MGQSSTPMGNFQGAMSPFRVTAPQGRPASKSPQNIPDPAAGSMRPTPAVNPNVRPQLAMARAIRGSRMEV